MTYIKWKDEVESYLVNLPQEEKQKIFSYFSEMYADKRDAGKSEEQIIEEFGAPYDVARRILADSREAAPQNGAPAAGGATTASGATAAGGNNYNYNYYNYNYGGAPQEGKELPHKEEPFAAPPPQPAPAKKRGAGHVILSVFLILVLTVLTVSLIGSALTTVIDGFITIGATSGALAAGECGGAEGTAMIGVGILSAGAGILLLAPFSALCSALWRKLKKFVKGA